MLAGSSGGWKFLLAVTWVFKPCQCRAGSYYCSSSGKRHVPVRPDCFPQPCHLLPASPQSLPSPLHRRESRLPSEQVNHIHSLIQVETICKKCWTEVSQAGKLHLSTNFQPVHPQCDNGASPLSLAAAFQPSMSEVCAETAQISQRMSRQVWFVSSLAHGTVLCPCRCFCVQLTVLLVLHPKPSQSTGRR